MLDVAREIVLELTRIVRRSRRLTRACQVVAALVVITVAWSMVSWLMRPGLSVQGTVTVAGVPLSNGAISFHKAEGASKGHGDGPPVSGAPIANGEYAIPAEHGLPPGTYVARIRSPKEDPNPPPDGTTPPSEERIPEKYNDSSKLVVEVSRFGRNRFDFRIP